MGKYIFIVTMLIPLHGIAGYCKLYKLETLKPNISKDYGSKLIAEINKASLKYQIDCKTIITVLFMESSFRLRAHNEVSKDYGIGQVSLYNIKAYKLDRKKLLTDLTYSLDKAIMILNWFKIRYKNKEPKKWIVRYNCGVKPSCIHTSKSKKYYSNFMKLKGELE